ncbi:MAG: helix-turn-helix transcriptional regulator [Clostridia bacterium]|nr:helix-turn-helix transcriptional regulator [Clostridia bacterium]
MATFSERLHDLRKERGLNQTELANALNVTLGTVSVWERGIRKPEVDTLERISDYFDVSLGYLFGSTDDRQPPAGIEAGEWLPENDQDTMLRYMILFSRMSDDSKEVVKSVIRAMHKADQDRGLLVEPDGELDQKLENLMTMR